VIEQTEARGRTEAGRRGRAASRARGRALRALAACALAAGTLATGASAAAAGTSGASTERLDPSNFGNPATGKSTWMPLVPGAQTVKVGHVNRGHRRLQHKVVTTVTDVTKEIDGIRTVGVLDQDIDGGEVGEQSIDWVAEDKDGNVWYLGSYTEAYEGGQFVNANDAWLAGTDGAKAGILMMANPTLKTPKWIEATVPGEGSATAKVAKTGVKVCVPFKCYKPALVIQEGGEYKSFARGVGGIKTEPKSSTGEDEVEELINFTKLSSTGLAELSNEVVKMDQHARSTSSDVFGSSQPAKRTL
jgi:hypothetical protein